MELRQLKYFVAVADAGGFASGARFLRVAQPALSRSIAKLEDEMQRPLFIRYGGGVSLTDTGRLCYDQAMSVLESARQLVELVVESDDALRGHLIIGAPQSVQSKMVIPIVSGFLERNPQCMIDLVQDSSTRLSERVLDGSVDIAIVSQRSIAGGIHEKPLLTESICLFAKPEDVVSIGERAEIADLAHLPLVICGYPTGLRHRLEHELKRYSDTVSIRSDVNASSLMLNLVKNGVGVGVAPSCVGVQELARNLKMIPIEGLEISWTLVTTLARRGSRLAEQFSQMLVEHVHQSIISGEWPTARTVESGSG